MAAVQPVAQGRKHRLALHFGRESWRLLALFSIVIALKTGNGFVTKAAALLIPLAIIGLLMARAVPARPLPAWAWVMATVLFAVLNASFEAGDTFDFSAAVILLIVCVLATILTRPWAVRAIFGAGAIAAMTFILASHWRWGSGLIDVFDIIQGGGAAIASGRNPYGPIYPHTAGLTYTYGPAVALLSAPAAWLGDARVANAVCLLAIIAGIGVVAWRHAGTPVAVVGTVLLAVVLPTSPFMVISGWTEVYPLAGFVWWLVLRERAPRAGMALLGVAIATKPTIWPVIGMMVFWWAAIRREVCIATLIAAIIILPFAIATGFRAFAYDVLGEFIDPNSAASTINAMEPSLTLTHVAREVWGITVAAPLSFALLIPLGIWMLRHPPRDLTGLFDACALAITAAVFAGRWAYFNYYVIPVMLLLLGFASAATPRPLTGTVPVRDERPRVSRAAGPLSPSRTEGER